MIARLLAASLVIVCVLARAGAQTAADDPLADAEAIVKAAGPIPAADDPLADAEAIVKAAGPIPAAGESAKLLATHELLMGPTAWRYHRCRVGMFGSYDFDLYVLYEDGTYACFESSFHADGSVDYKYNDKNYFMNSSELNAMIEHVGRWKLGSSGEIDFKVERISRFVREARDFKREDYTTGWRRPRTYYFDRQHLRLDKYKVSEYDLEKTGFYAKHFGTTASEAVGSKYLVPL